MELPSIFYLFFLILIKTNIFVFFIIDQIRRSLRIFLLNYTCMYQSTWLSSYRQSSGVKVFKGFEPQITSSNPPGAFVNIIYY